MKEVEASNSDMVENMKQICDTMEVMTECINQSDEASRTMLSKYEESSVNVDKIESVVGKPWKNSVAADSWESAMHSRECAWC